MNPLFLQTHCQKDKLNLQNPDYEKWVLQHTLEEFKKDTASSGDITTNFIFSSDKTMKAKLFAKAKGILAGIEEIIHFLGSFPNIHAEFFKKDGAFVLGSSQNPELIATFEGSLYDLLKTERVILNFIGRMSGVATLTKQFVDLAQAVQPEILVTPTRKTLWGLLDKKACVIGGGGTHRLSLSDAILIKHNHIRAYGSDVQLPLRKAVFSTFEVNGVKSEAPKFIEVEVKDMDPALKASRILSDAKKKEYPLPCFVMFDNMSPLEIKKALEEIKKNKLNEGVFFEVSGGITLENVQDYAKTGVDIISVGAITHSAPMFDFSFRIV